MYIEDLEATNLRQEIRKSDIVSAYWPIMSKTDTLDNELKGLRGTQLEMLKIRYNFQNTLKVFHYNINSYLEYTFHS